MPDHTPINIPLLMESRAAAADISLDAARATGY